MGRFLGWFLFPLLLLTVQLAIAMFLLYNSLGAAVITSVVGIMCVLVFVVLGTRRNNRFQSNVMKCRDSRMKATNEMVNYMRVIKFQAWEEHFNKRIQAFRESEFSWLTKFMYSISANVVVMRCTPVLISTLTFGTALLLGVRLDAGTLFTTTSIFNFLRRTFPQSMTSISQAMIFLGRLDCYMMSRELVEDAVERDKGCDSRTAVEVKHAVFSCDDESKEEDLNVNEGELTAIVGTVGSGKSSLLASILGEMHKLSGKVRVCGTTAFVAQTSWIQNGTTEESILFGLPMDRDRYQEVIRVCCLEKDLEMMKFGDQTEIGECGINLSGGQKQRIQLARAVYQNCDIYLLDDVFSAVDAHTGSEICKVMRDGMVVQAGKYNDLLNSGLDFKELVAAHETSMELVEMSTTIPSKSSPSPQISPQLSSNHREANGGNNSLDQPKSDNRTSKLIKEEEKETGKVSFYYLASSRELTRLNSITKAPVIHHFSENISGVMTIHSWKIQNMFSKENVKQVNANLLMDFHNSGSNEWFGFRMEMLGSLVFCISTMVSVERIKQFINIPSEAAWEIKDRLPPSNWPSRGNVELKDLQIGVVGRTGSMKSTLIQVFFRLVEPSGGKIIIDGIDITTIGLHDIRSRFGVIPQEPVLFEGTVRSNIDPVGIYSDEEIWKSLERCQLKDVVAAKPYKLNSLVADDGNNWSVGQRQLLFGASYVEAQPALVHGRGHSFS
ncbi:ABC transporter C family member 14-like [Prunus yedoensis var. nudiflora]|uniref:ABC-type xenobiotic transporter n=1 Tax=Prunus yedoensis var. nudiflora TaxID=2094558 RepID=A0A314URI4_PRUYE|nr:ABC transporter C family member 14-like [Prunus yedoensis var. nudiflora]